MSYVYNCVITHTRTKLCMLRSHIRRRKHLKKNGSSPNATFRRQQQPREEKRRPVGGGLLMLPRCVSLSAATLQGTFFDGLALSLSFYLHHLSSILLLSGGCCITCIPKGDDGKRIRKKGGFRITKIFTLKRYSYYRRAKYANELTHVFFCFLID